MIATIVAIDFEFVVRAWDARVEAICRSWDGTPYMEGQHSKGEAVDCVHAVCSVLDELYGYSRAPGLKKLRGDTSLHDPEGSKQAMRAILEIYPFHHRVNRAKDHSLESGDIVVVGPKNGGPGHVLIAGGRRGVLWHACSPIGFSSTGYGLPHTERLFHVYRPTDKILWANRVGG